MPDIKLPYTPESDELVENIKEEVEEVGGNITNAAERTESYQLGGLIPGMEGFGKRPIIGRNKPMNVTSPLKPIRDDFPLDEVSPIRGLPNMVDLPYKKGGKVKKKY